MDRSCCPHRPVAQERPHAGGLPRRDWRKTGGLLEKPSPWQRTSSPVGARVARVLTVSRRIPSQAGAARVLLTVWVAADNQASPGDELQAVPGAADRDEPNPAAVPGTPLPAVPAPPPGSADAGPPSLARVTPTSSCASRRYRRTTGDRQRKLAVRCHQRARNGACWGEDTAHHQIGRASCRERV